MPIELPRGLPFAVDTWTPASALKRHRFLTHAHRDHLAGITTTNVAAVYASRLTIFIARHIFPQLDRSDTFVELEVGAPVLVPDPDGDFTVTAFDANHCPGAVMLLFEGSFGTVLHTGDCRLTADCLHALPLSPPSPSPSPSPCRVADYVFLDCTFANCSLQFPTKEASIRQVINCIWEHPNAPVVYLVSDMLGQEEILIEVCKVFGSKIYVDREKNSECYHTLSHVAPDILADDAPSSRFQVIAFPRLSERATEMLALARAKQQPEPLIIRASSQWYACYEPAEGSAKKKPALTEPMRDEFGVWHVCFSIHSSREELEQALRLIQPKWVISTTPPCLAMELSYVKKHCFASRLLPDDPLWKLLRLSDGKPAVSGSPQAAPIVETIKQREEEDLTSSVDEPFCADRRKMQDEEALTPEDFEVEMKQPVTLFGIARFGLPQEPELWKDEYDSVGVIEEDGLQVQGQNSVTESEQCKDGKSDISSAVIDSTAVVSKEQNSALESELLKDHKPDNGIKAIDLTEVEVKEHNPCTESILWKKYRCNERVMGIQGGESEAEEQKLTGICQLWKDCKPRETESVELIEQGQNNTDATNQLSAVDNLFSSQESSKMVREEGAVPLETDYKNSEAPDKTSGNSSDVIGSSKGLNANLRRLYRSMNVPVPRPLPSLVELMGASKRPRVYPAVQL